MQVYITMPIFVHCNYIKALKIIITSVTWKFIPSVIQILRRGVTEPREDSCFTLTVYSSVIELYTSERKTLSAHISFDFKLYRFDIHFF